MLTVSRNGNPIMFNIYIEIKYTKNLYNEQGPQHSFSYN